MSAKNGKPCKKCGTSDWRNNGQCRKCKREYKRQWKKSNQDKVADDNRRWRQANREKDSERKRRWQQANPDKVAGHNRSWHQANRDRAAEKGSQYKRNNPEKINAQIHRRRTRKTEAGGSYTVTEWLNLCDHYGNMCLSCKRTDVKLTADHIKPASRGGHSNIDNIQPLCLSCNSIKNDRHIDYRPDAGPLRWLQAKLFG